MNNKTIEFSLASEMTELAKFLAVLNQAGVPYSLRKDSVAIAVTVGTGF